MFVIGGAPRSGTSLLSSILSQVPEISVAHDTGLFYYVKLSIFHALVKIQYGNSVNTKHLPGLLHLNDLRNGNHYSQFLDLSPRQLISMDPHDDMSRKFLDYFLAQIWTFWTKDSLEADPTKDRGNGNTFLEQLDGKEIMDASSMRELVRLLVNKYAFAMNSKDPQDSDLVIGEKTPENTICGDLIESIVPDCKYICLYRDPVSVYGAKKRRMKLSALEFSKWYNSVSSFKFIDEDRVLILQYSEILENPNQVIAKVISYLDVSSSFGLSDTFRPPAHYAKYVGEKIDSSREIHLQSLVDDEERAVIYQNCTYPWW